MPVVNLIPPLILERRKRQLLLIRIGTGAGIFLLLVFSVNTYLEAKIRDLKNKIAHEEKTISELQAKIDELKRIEAENEMIKKRINVLEGLIKGRVKYVAVLDRFLACNVPNVWITSLSLTENHMDISGVALTNYDIADYMVSLMDSGTFYNVELHGISEGEIEGMKVKNFSLSFDYQL
jgi:Tfp pilus assembly protein PilN